MIVRVWGIVNSTEVEFTPVLNKPGYWEGLAPKIPGLQEIEIWAENSNGARGHLKCNVQIHYGVSTYAKLILLPFIAELVERYTEKSIPQRTHAHMIQCRKAAG